MKLFQRKREPEPGDNRVAAEMTFHIVHGEIEADQAVFRAIRVEDDTEIDEFTINAQDRSGLSKAVAR